MKKIIILNGPPQCGKDTLANFLFSMFENVVHVKFANELKTMTHRLYNTDSQQADAYEALKQVLSEDFHGLTPRQSYINVSESYVKKFHGKDFFGKQLCRTIDSLPKNENTIFIVSDGGFIEEVIPLVTTYGSDKIAVIKIK